MAEIASKLPLFEVGGNSTVFFLDVCSKSRIFLCEWSECGKIVIYFFLISLNSVHFFNKFFNEHKKHTFKKSN